MRRVPPSIRLKEEFVSAMKDATTEHPMRNFVQRSAQLLLQTAIEEQVEEFLGRGHYERGERRRRGWRNGYSPVSLKTEAGPVELSRPKLRATSEPYELEIPAGLGTRTRELEALAVRAYVRGLSTRDVSGLYDEVFGGQLSKSAVSRAVAGLDEHFRAWRSRDLSAERIVYLFLDGQYHALRSGTSEREGVLTIYGIREDGSPVLLHMATGPRESYDAWLGVLHELVARGLNEPLLVIFDGNPGLKRAVREVFPKARRQRCQVHKMRNILAKLPRMARAQMKQLVHQVFLAPDHETAIRRGKALISRFVHRFPDAMRCLEADLGVRGAPAVPCRASQADPNHEPDRADVRGKPAANQGRSSLPDRTVLSHADVRDVDHGVGQLARSEDDAEDSSRSESTARGPGHEGASCSMITPDPLNFYTKNRT